MKKKISQLFLSNFSSLAITMLLSNVIRLATNLFIASILAPSAFAIVGLANTVVMAFNMVTDGGFKAFILKDKRGDSEHFIASLWTIQLARNIILAVILFLFADIVAFYIGIIELGEVLKWLSVVFIVDGIRPFTNYLAERRNEVSKVLYTDFLSYLLSTCVTFFCVSYLQSYWGVIIGIISNSLFMCFTYILILGRFGMKAKANSKLFREFFSWAKFIIPSSTITLILTQSDKIILGKTMDPKTIGLYFVAFTFSSAATTFVIKYSRSVLEPKIAFAYRSSPSDFKNVYYGSKTKISCALAFGVSFASAAAFILFDTLYDERYSLSSEYLSLLLIAPLLAIFSYPSESAMILHGFVRATLTTNIIRLSWLLILGPLSLIYYGPKWFIIVAVTTDLLPICYSFYMLYKLEILHLHIESYALISSVLGYALGTIFLMLYKVI